MERRQPLGRIACLTTGLLLGLSTLAAAQVGGSQFLVNEYSTGYQHNPKVALTPNGDFMVVWATNQSQDGDFGAVMGRRYTSAGDPKAGEFVVNSYTTGSQSLPDVAALAGGERGERAASGVASPKVPEGSTECLQREGARASAG